MLVGMQLFATTLLRAQTVSRIPATSGLDIADVIRTTLATSVAIRRSLERKHVRESELQTARGAFDLTIGFSISTDRNSTLFDRAQEEIYGTPAVSARTTAYRLSAAREFKSGATITPSIEVVRHDVMAPAAPPFIQTQAGLSISYPVLRAGRATSNAKMVAASTLRLEASDYDVRHTRAASLLRAIDAYWNYLEAYEALEIRSDSERKAERLLHETRSLVDGGERASSDLDQLHADLADRFAERLRAEHDLYEARQFLGMEMGLTDEQASVLPPPVTAFPQGSAASLIDFSDELLARAYQRRHDLAEVNKEADASRKALDARQIETMPSLLVRVHMGYAARTEDQLTIAHHLSPFGRNDVRRPNTSLTFVLEWPTTNNRARGARAREEAILRQLRIDEQDLRRQIASGIKVAVTQLRTSANELVKTKEAVGLYQVAVESEKKRLQLGMSTQFDLVLVEERLRNTMLSRLAAEVRHARSVTRLLYETGTLPATEPATWPEDSIDELLLSPATLE